MIVMVDSLKKKQKVEKLSVPLAEKMPKSTDGIKPEVVQNTSIAVQGEPKKEAVPVNAPESQFIGIADLVKDISDDKVAMAENLGIPIRGILTWAAVIEANVINQGKALQQLGVNLQPVVELAQKVKASQTPGVNPGATGAPKDAGGLQMLMGLLQQTGLVGQGGTDVWGEKLKEMVMESGLRSFTLTSRIGEAVLNQTYKQWIPQEVAKKTMEAVA